MGFLTENVVNDTFLALRWFLMVFFLTRLFEIVVCNFEDTSFSLGIEIRFCDDVLLGTFFLTKSATKKPWVCKSADERTHRFAWLNVMLGIPRPGHVGNAGANSQSSCRRRTFSTTSSFSSRWTEQVEYVMCDTLRNRIAWRMSSIWCDCKRCRSSDLKRWFWRTASIRSWVKPDLNIPCWETYDGCEKWHIPGTCWIYHDRVHLVVLFITRTTWSKISTNGTNKMWSARLTDTIT